MDNIDINIKIIKNIIIDKNIKLINKNNMKIIKVDYTKEKSDISMLENYNYHVKLLKRVKKYINEYKNYEMIYKVGYDKFENTICILTKFSIYEMEIGMPIDINVITGKYPDTYMNCTYYMNEENGLLYINDFKSPEAQRGYGGAILYNLDYIIKELNNKLKDNKLKGIEYIEGILVANKNVISEEELKKLYEKHGFSIDYKNNIKKQIRC